MLISTHSLACTVVSEGVRRWVRQYIRREGDREGVQHLVSLCLTHSLACSLTHTHTRMHTHARTHTGLPYVTGYLLSRYVRACLCVRASVRMEKKNRGTTYCHTQPSMTKHVQHSEVDGYYSYSSKFRGITYRGHGKSTSLFLAIPGHLGL